MPQGNPSKQSIATRKYEAKTGWISKSYKMKRDITIAFKEACERNGDSQAGVLMEFMKEYVKEHSQTLPNETLDTLEA